MPAWSEADCVPSYVCHIDATSLTSQSSTSLSQQTVFAAPVSRLIPRIRMRTRQAPSLLGQKILVTIDRWDVTSRYPEGHFVRALGHAESKEARIGHSITFTVCYDYCTYGGKTSISQ